MEVTLSDVVLIITSALGWGLMWHYKQKHDMAEFFIRKLIEDETLRNQVVESYKAFTANKAARSRE
jgi:hypothetical protein